MGFKAAKPLFGLKLKVSKIIKQHIVNLVSVIHTRTVIYVHPITAPEPLWLGHALVPFQYPKGIAAFQVRLAVVTARFGVLGEPRMKTRIDDDNVIFDIRMGNA